MKAQRKLYLRTPLFGNEFKVLDEITEEVIAIFYSQQNAIDYITLFTNQNKN
jgi:hypothetical protein